MNITRSEAITMLRNLAPNRIASVTFVARGDESQGISPYVRTMAFRTGVKSHLKGGELPYTPEDHGLMAVFEVLNRKTAIKLYKNAARKAVSKLGPEIVSAKADLNAAYDAWVAGGGADAKGNKGRTLKVEAARRKLSRLVELQDLEQVKIHEPARAVAAQLKATLDRLQEKQVSLEKRMLDFENTPGTPHEAKMKLKSELEEIADRQKRTENDLLDPVSTLLRRYRMINLVGLLELRTGGKTYTITTPPVPGVPADKTPRIDD